MYRECMCVKYLELLPCVGAGRLVSAVPVFHLSSVSSSLQPEDYPVALTYVLSVKGPVYPLIIKKKSQVFKCKETHDSKLSSSS